MRYRSTRGGPVVTLDTALLTGLAPDGGLYVPVALPRHAADDWPGEMTAHALAVEYLTPFFADSRLADALDDIVAETFNFSLPMVSLRRELGAPVSVLELFHGPTAAFKDVGARFLAACLTRLDQETRNDKPLTILVATSGDTGGAVASAFHGRTGVRVVVLFPDGRVSPRQQHQLTCWGDNVTSLAVRGTFDDCQQMVKAAFVDEALAEQYRFSSANSINIGRLLPQSVYYAAASYAYFRAHGERLHWIVPTGNLGNGLAAVIARACGMPMGDIAFVTNANRTLPDYLTSGDYEPRPSLATLASAMDVGAPSNLERLRDLFGESDALRQHALTAQSVSDEEIEARIRADIRRLPFAWCPHSATAMVAWERLAEGDKARHWALVATAHPAKFETIVEPLIGTEVAVPPMLAELLDRPSNYVTIDAGLDALRAHLL
ncbi:MAG: threonine synthase [Pseudomonadota bacterium]